MSARHGHDYRRVSNYPRAKNDWYVEPPEAVEALIRAEAFEGHVYDPACGAGNIVKVFEAAGFEAYGSDLVPRRGVEGEKSWDYLKLGSQIPRPDNIVSNPPFGIAEDFLRQALLSTQRKICFLLRLAFLESEGRRWVFNETPLARVHVFSWRVSMPPGDSSATATGGKTAFAWFVWERGHVGPWTGHRLERP